MDAADASRVNWQKNIQREISREEWSQSHMLIRTLSINVALRGNYFKVCHLWYLTPSRISRMFPAVSAVLEMF